MTESKNPPKMRNLVSSAGDAAVDHVEDARSDNHQPGVEEHAALVLGMGIAEENARDYIDQQPDEGECVGRDAGQREAMDNFVQQPLARSSNCARPGHMPR